jgi:hypothetical protein
MDSFWFFFRLIRFSIFTETSAIAIFNKIICRILSLLKMFTNLQRKKKKQTLRILLEPGAGGSLALAIQEAEIRSIMVQSQPRQIVCET